MKNLIPKFFKGIYCATTLTLVGAAYAEGHDQIQFRESASSPWVAIGRIASVNDDGTFTLSPSFSQLDPERPLKLVRTRLSSKVELTHFSEMTLVCTLDSRASEFEQIASASYPITVICNARTESGYINAVDFFVSEGLANFICPSSDACRHSVTAQHR